MNAELSYHWNLASPVVRCSEVWKERKRSSLKYAQAFLIETAVFSARRYPYEMRQMDTAYKSSLFALNQRNGLALL